MSNEAGRKPAISLRTGVLHTVCIQSTIALWLDYVRPGLPTCPRIEPIAIKTKPTTHSLRECLRHRTMEKTPPPPPPTTPSTTAAAATTTNTIAQQRPAGTQFNRIRLGTHYLVHTRTKRCFNKPIHKIKVQNARTHCQSNYKISTERA